MHRHLNLTSVLSAFSIRCRTDKVHIPDVNREQWLTAQAQAIVANNIRVKNPSYPEEDDDQLYSFHRTFMYMGFLYTNLRDAVRHEDGPRILSMWRYWFIHFLGAGRRNYAREAANLQANLRSDWPDEIVHMHTYNRTVNMTGKTGGGKPIDMLNEHYNL